MEKLKDAGLLTKDNLLGDEIPIKDDDAGVNDAEPDAADELET